MGLKEEFRKIILFIQEHGGISNSDVQTLCGVSKATATRYLGELETDYVEKIGTTGVGTTYVLKGLTKGSRTILQEMRFKVLRNIITGKII